MLRIGIAFLAGHVSIHSLAVLPPLWPWALLPVALIVILSVSRLPAGVALMLGILFAWFNAAARLADDLPTRLEGLDLVVIGDVASLPDATGTDILFEFEVVSSEAAVPSRIRLAWYDGVARPHPGERWQFVVRLKRRGGFANPGGFDYEAQLLRQSIGATGYIRDDVRNLRVLPPQAGYAVLRIRAWLAGRIKAAVGDHPALGILQGLAVGETQSMSTQQWRVFAATGTTHLMAISGLHITMIAAMAAWLGGRIVLWRGAQHHRLTAMHGQILCGSLAALGYSLLAGMSVPTQRTLAMLGIACAFRALRREIGIDRILGIALIAVLLLDSFAPLAAGAWLSFGAVAAILLATAGKRGREGAVGSFTRVQLAVTVGLMPLIIGAFGSVSLISPLANLAAIPLFTFIIVPAVLCGTLLAALWLPAGSVLLGAAAWLLQSIWPILVWLAELPLALWHLPQLPIVVHIAFLLGAVLLLLPGIAPTRAAALLLCLPALIWRPAVPAQGEYRLTLLDVGQGLSAVIRTHSHVLVFDTGPSFRSGRDTGELVVLPYLRSQGVQAIDALVISHGDLDHDGGMESLANGISVRRWLVGPSVDTGVHEAELCTRGQKWTWDGVTFEVLHPATATYAHDNDSSCVLRVSGAGGSTLLTGDIQHDAEAALVSAGLGQTDIVVAAHHGSRTSSTQPLVDATRPSLVLFAAGYRNRWGFPKPEVIERWRSSGAHAIATPQSGAVDVLVSLQGVQPPGEFRRDCPRYWRAR